MIDRNEGSREKNEKHQRNKIIKEEDEQKKGINRRRANTESAGIYVNSNQDNQQTYF